jgi:hypothetical protein
MSLYARSDRVLASIFGPQGLVYAQHGCAEQENTWLNRAASAPGGNRSSIGPGRLWGLQEKQIFFHTAQIRTRIPQGGPVINTITWGLESELVGKELPRHSAPLVCGRRRLPLSLFQPQRSCGVQRDPGQVHGVCGASCSCRHEPGETVNQAAAACKVHRGLAGGARVCSRSSSSTPRSLPRCLHGAGLKFPQGREYMLFACSPSALMVPLRHRRWPFAPLSPKFSSRPVAQRPCR